MTDDWALFAAILIPFMAKSYQKEGGPAPANSTNAIKKCIEILLRPVGGLERKWQESTPSSFAEDYWFVFIQIGHAKIYVQH